MGSPFFKAATSRHRLAGVLIAAMLLVPSALAQGLDSSSKVEKLEGVGIDQRLDETIPLDLEFLDERGRTVELGDYFSEKPVVLAMVYYECPMLCTLVLNGLLRGMNPMRFSVGEEFDVVAVSIDPGETPEMAARKKERYLHLYDRESARQGWHFLTGREEDIRELANAAGFRYRYDPETGNYVHAAGVMVLTPRGKLSRYFYGIDYAPTDLRLALVESSRGRIGNAVDQLLLYCFSYDPELGKYSAVVMNILRLAGIATLLALGLFIVVSIRRDRSAEAGAN